MSNTIIILVVLGVINFLIRKFATKPTVPSSMQDEQDGARPIQISAPMSAQTAVEIATRKFSDQARALGLVDENGNYIFSRQATDPSAPVAAKPKSKSVKTPRVTQKPIGVTDFSPKASAIASNRAGQSALSRAVALPVGQLALAVGQSALAVGQSALVSKLTPIQTPKKPISAIDALVASRLSQRIAPATQAGQRAQPKRIWNAKSMRQGMIMAEILSPPVALR